MPDFTISKEAQAAIAAAYRIEAEGGEEEAIKAAAQQACDLLVRDAARWIAGEVTDQLLATVMPLAQSGALAAGGTIDVVRWPAAIVGNDYVVAKRRP